MHPLLKQIRFVARRARALVFYRGVAWFVCAVLAAAFLAGWMDYWFRFAEQGLRWLVSAAVAAIVVWCLLRFVWPALWVRRSDTFFAQMIERRFPDLRDRLSSAIAFLREPGDDPKLGSPSLRAAVVTDAAQAVAELNVLDCLDARATRIALAVSLATLVVIVGICATDTQSAILAGHRLMMPWRDEAWPRRNWLEFIKRPEKLAVGEEFVAELRDRRGWLPSEVTMLYWFDGDPESDVRAHRMEYAGGKMTARLPGVTHSFRYRATGGDDQQMEWTRLQVVEAPRVVESRAVLRPPAYTGLPEETADRAWRGFVGTNVEFTGRASKPMSSATLLFATGKELRRDSAVVSPDGMSFQLPAEKSRPWLLVESGNYGWLLVDRDGVAQRGAPKIPVDVVKDEAPTVAILNPPNLKYTAGATIPLNASVKDDLAIQRVVLHVNEQATPLVEVSTPPAISVSEAWPPRGEQRVIEYSVALEQITGLKAGDTVHIRLIASDFKPQDSAAAELAVTIITPDELTARVQQEQASLLKRLQETLRLQQTIYNQSRSWHESLPSSEGPSAINDETAQGIVLGQQRVGEQLGGDAGSIRIVEQMLEELVSNHIAESQLASQLTSIQTEIRRLAADVVPPIQNQLEQSAKLHRLGATTPTADSKNVKTEMSTSLSSATAGQQRVIASIAEIVDRLSHWSSYQTLAREVEQMRNEEESLLRDLRSISTAARELNQLSAEERSMLQRMVDHQGDLAWELDRLRQRLERMREQLGDGDPSAASAMDRSLNVLDQKSLGTQMRDAAQQLAKNRVGSAVNKAEQIIEGLKELQETLENSQHGQGGSEGQPTASQQLQLLAKVIGELSVAQRDVTSGTEALARQKPENGRPPDTVRSAAEQLASRQDEIAKRTAGVTDQTDSIPALSGALKSITGLMHRASSGLRESQLGDPTLRPQRAAAARLQQLAEALQNPEALKNQGATDADNMTNSSDGQDASQQRGPFGAVELRVLRDWQLEVNHSTQELAEARGDTSELTADQRQNLEALAADEKLLAQYVEKLVSQAAETGETSPTKPENRAPDRASPSPDDKKTPGDDGDKSKRNLDDQLFNDLAPTKGKTAETNQQTPRSPSRQGEDIGQRPEAAPRLAEVGRQMQKAESLLRSSDTSPTTRELQEHIAADLSQMIEELEQKNAPQRSQHQTSPNQTAKQPGDKSTTADPSGTATPTRGSNSVVGDERARSSNHVWGTLPENVRQRFNNLGDEQFLPQFEDVIQQYYERLSERGRKEP